MENNIKQRVYVNALGVDTREIDATTRRIIKDMERSQRIERNLKAFLVGWLIGIGIHLGKLAFQAHKNK